MSEVLCNGERRPVTPGTTVAALVAAVTSSPRGIAVALNGEVVPRSAWITTALTDGDTVEIVTAAAGG